jgi:hypothetical protein
VSQAQQIGVFILAGVLSLPAFPQAAGAPAGNSHPAPQSQPKQKTGRQLGDWLRDHKDLSPDQQEKLLEKDPSFQKLSPDRQSALKDRLRKFNSLPPAQRERALNRMQFMSSLTQEQRKEVRDANQQLQSLPNDRKIMVHKALRNLRQMPPQQRQQVLESDHFKSTFSPQEQGILKQLSDMTPTGASASAPK